MLKAGKYQAENYIGNTIQFDTKIRVEGLTINRLQKNRWHVQPVCDEMKQTYRKSDH